MGRKKSINPKAMFSKSLLIPPTQKESSPFTKNPVLKKKLILRKRDPMSSLLGSISQIKNAMGQSESSPEPPPTDSDENWND